MLCKFFHHYSKPLAKTQHAYEMAPVACRNDCPHFLAERPRMDLAGCSPCRQLHRTAYPHRSFSALPHSGAVRPVWSPSARRGRRLSLPQESVRNDLLGKPGHPRTNSGFGGGLTQIEQKIRLSRYNLIVNRKRPFHRFFLSKIQLNRE